MAERERTGWRDQEISNRHREWGFDCPAVDTDFLMVEYTEGRARAVVDYKHAAGRGWFEGASHPNFRAQGDLYTRRGAQLPFWIAWYWPDVWAFRVLPINNSAVAWFGPRHLDLTEYQYVHSLHQLRQHVIDPTVAARLNHVMPPPPSALDFAWAVAS
jgi:hypothetical protein